MWRTSAGKQLDEASRGDREERLCGGPDANVLISSTMRTVFGCAPRFARTALLRAAGDPKREDSSGNFARFNGDIASVSDGDLLRDEQAETKAA